LNALDRFGRPPRFLRGGDLGWRQGSVRGQGEISRLDAISVDYDDWHFNVRPSNTEPLVRLNLESLISREHMENKRDEVLSLIRA
jgi:phosphomannomutase